MKDRGSLDQFTPFLDIRVVEFPNCISVSRNLKSAAIATIGDQNIAV